MIKKNGKTKLTPEEIRLSQMPEFELRMREAASIASTIVGTVAAHVTPGKTLNDLEMVGAKLFSELGATPANYQYKPAWAKVPYPSVMCLSVNEVIAHGIPNDYKLKEGDILNIDTGVDFNGYKGDCAMTVPVGKISKENERLIEKAKKVCYLAIMQVKAGVSVSEIGKAVEDYAKMVGYSINETFSGHDIGEEMHGTGAIIPNFYSRDSDYLQRFALQKLKAGQVICIEPFLSDSKDRRGQLLGDGWGLVNSDGGNSAMFEHMVLVTEDGYEILTDHFINE
jgi:methionyl aminopeptidase